MAAHHPAAFRHCLAGALLLLVAWPGLAQTPAQAPAGGVYRCGNSYSDAPCPGGQPVAAADARSTAQQRQAQEVRQRDAAMAEQLAAERRARERAAGPQRAAGIGPQAADAAKAAKPAASAPQPRKVKKTQPRPTKAPKPTRSSRAESRPQTAFMAISSRYLDHSWSLLSGCCGSTGMQATGQSCTH